MNPVWYANAVKIDHPDCETMEMMLISFLNIEYFILFIYSIPTSTSNLYQIMYGIAPHNIYPSGLIMAKFLARYILSKIFFGYFRFMFACIYFNDLSITGAGY